VLITNHVLSGALIGALTRHPVPAFAIGVASHFALDALPHWGEWRSRGHFMSVAVPDGLTGLATMGLLTAVARPEQRLAVMAGMAGAALPDLDKPAMMWLGGSPWPAVVDRFHTEIQDEAPDRCRRELATAALLAVAGVLAIRMPGRAIASRRAIRSGRAGARGRR